MSQPPRTLSDAKQQLRSKAVSSVDLVQGCLTAADEADAELGVFVSRFPDGALAAAREADRAHGQESKRRLLGLPMAVKDMIATGDGVTTAQSLVHDSGWHPQDSVVVERLRDAGAVIVGKTTTMEFALGAPDPDKPFPIPRNPWDPRRWAGGSSSGSGSGVVTGMFLGSLGTDTGASVRMPSALCGLTGIKPTFGRVPKEGCVPLAYSLDCIGPMARSARDCAELLAVIAGPSDRDPFSAKVAVPDYTAALTGNLRGVRVGVDGLERVSGERRDPVGDLLLADVVAQLREAGAQIVEVQLPYYRQVTAAQVIITFSEALAYHAPDIRTRWPDYFAATRVALALGAFISGADYVQAQRVRRTGQLALQNLFGAVDVILTPTVSRPAPAIEEAAEYTATLFAGKDLTFHTAYWNVMGNPALSMPMGFTPENLPLGAQLIGRPFDEGTVLKVADAYQRRTGFHLRTPPAPGAEFSGALPPSDLSRAVPSAGDRSALVHEALAWSGISVPTDELPAVAGALDHARQAVDLLYGLSESRYEIPGFELGKMLDEILWQPVV